MNLITELKYNTQDFDNIDLDDLIIVFEGNITIIHSNDYSNDNISKAIDLLQRLCNKFDSMSYEIFSNDGNLKPLYSKNNYQNIISAIMQFSGYPKLIIGEIEESAKYEGWSLYIDNDWYDVLNSKELYQLIKTNLLYRYFSSVTINNEEYRIEDIISLKDDKMDDVPLSNPLYHGTCEKYLLGILQKGLKKIQDNSVWTAKNDGYVFLTVDYQTAQNYGDIYARKTNSHRVVLEIDSNYLNKNNIVLDYDFTNSFTRIGGKSPYDNGEVPYTKHHKGNVISGEKRYGTKFNKIGYKGVIMPNAIKMVTIGAYRMTPQEYLNKYNKKNDVMESKQIINEWYYPDNFESLPDKITLYQGTDYDGLENILWEGIIDARRGTSTGETRGMNWFFVSYRDNFSRGFIYSIDIDKNEINKTTDGFKYMNNSEIANYEPISINNRNFTIHEAFGYEIEDLKNVMWRRCLQQTNNDIYEAIYLWIDKFSNLSGVQKYDISINNDIIQQILKQFIGEDELRNQGIIENTEYINENPDHIIVQDSQDPAYNGYYRHSDNCAIAFIVNSELTEVYVSEYTHEDIIYDDIYDEDYEQYKKNFDEKWLRQNSFHGRLWTEPQIISFWKQPSPQQLIKIAHLLENKINEEFMENIDIINDYRIETFYNNKTDESTFIPISVYIEGKEKQDNNFDMNVIHLMDGEKKVKTPQMQDYIKNREKNQSEKLGQPNNSREVSTAEYNYYKKYGMGESIINEVSSSDINLSSFKPKTELHPKLWVNNKLNSRVRLRLLDISDDFIDTLSVDWVKPKDVIFTGSLANYNWSKYSDIDIHIIFDYNNIYKKPEFVEDYFNAKKEIWLNEHPNLKIYGFPVEMYVEDSNSDNSSSGVYSLYKNKWIKEPGDFQNAKLNEKYIKNYASKIMTQIDTLEKKQKNETDEYKIELLQKKLKSIFDKLKKLRKESLSKQGEMGSGNIIYKILRRSKYIDKIWDLINTSYDKINSIQENKLK